MIIKKKILYNHWFVNIHSMLIFMSCNHTNIRCLNHYCIFRRYHCLDCENVLICKCEESLATKFLPHQARITEERIDLKVKSTFINGFGVNLCAACRGEKEEAHPKAAIYGLKGKVERYYWREIFKTYCTYVENWLNENNKSINDITEFDFNYPNEAKILNKKAKEFWKKEHRKNPKYDTTELSEAQFLRKIPVHIETVFAPYVHIIKNNQKIGKWKSQFGLLESPENIAKHWYENKGYNVIHCERSLISAWVGTFLCYPIQSTNDEKSKIVMRHSTVNWTSKSRNTPLIYFRLPEDFGSSDYYLRRKESIDDWINGFKSAINLMPIFEALLEDGTSLRDYLWANDEKSLKIAANALEVMKPKEVVTCLKWAIEDFWNRQPGWPDLFIYKNNEYKFVEVKSPHDRLSIEQMNWFEWAITESKIPCEICRIKEEKPPNSK